MRDIKELQADLRRLTSSGPPISGKSRGKARGKFNAALLAAAGAILVNALTVFATNYLTRRDMHVEEADRCNSFAATLVTTTTFARQAAQAAADALAQPVPPGGKSKFFILPPIDQVLHHQERYLYMLNINSQSIIFQLEMYYQSIRADLSHSPDVKAEGDSFLLAPGSPNRAFYANLLRQIAREAGAAVQSLQTSRHCADLSRTAFFWSGPRARHNSFPITERRP